MNNEPPLSPGPSYWKPSDAGWRYVSLPEKPSHKLLVKAVEGEPNRFFVESESLFCVKCSKIYGAKFVAQHRLKNGGVCPEQGCGGRTETYYYVCDLAAWGLNGSCNCTWFEMHLGPEISKTKPERWASCEFRCKHLRASAALSQLIYTELMERERYKNQSHRRRQEGAGA